jgi:hypothetical protein
MIPEARWFPVIAVVLALAIINVWISLSPPQTAPIERRPHAQSARLPQISDTNASSLQPQLTHSLSRPLFLENRKPWSPPLPISAASPPLIEAKADAPSEHVMDGGKPIDPAKLSLLGIATRPGSARALVMTAGQADAKWVTPGETFDGWTVSSVDENSIRLFAGNRSEVVELYQTEPPTVGDDGEN